MSDKVSPSPSRFHPPPNYRPKEFADGPRRSCCRRCFSWCVVTVLAIIVLVGLAIGVFFAIYRPTCPTFSVTSLHLPIYNLTRNDELFLRLDVEVTTRNPSSNGLSYIYQPISISTYTFTHTGETHLANGSFPAFVHSSRETRLLKATLRRDGEILDAMKAREVRKKNRVSMTVKLNTEARIKAGSLKLFKAKIDVDCGRFLLPLPKLRAPEPTAILPSGTCHVDFKVKIWRWLG